MIKLSVIIPTLNEANHIEQLVASVMNLDTVEKEVFIVDGGSRDGTREIVTTMMKTRDNLYLIDNPEKYVSNGFNLAFTQAKGQYLSLIGAHSIYPKDYFSTCIQHIAAGECEAAGGFLNHEGSGYVGKAIAHAMSTKFGVGNTDFRTNPKQGYVESVAFAVYDRQVFEKAGLFDEQMLRNQDDEFHYRLKQHRLRILMLPELITTYHVRDSLPALFLQYYQYGYYKPLVFKKTQGYIRIRHVVPALFSVYLLSMPLAFFWPIWAIPAIAYVLLSSYFSLIARLPFASKMALLLVFPTLHLAYGIGFLLGLWRWNLEKY